MNKKQADHIQEGFDLLKLSNKRQEKYSTAEEYARRFTKCSVLEFKNISYSNSTSIDPKTSIQEVY